MRKFAIFVALLCVMNVLFFLVILPHELGHAVAMKAVGAEVERIRMGFGPLLFAHTFANGFTFELGTVHLGGFTQPTGAGVAVLKHSAWRDIVVTLAGTFVNVMMAWGIFSALGRRGVVRPERATFLQDTVVAWMLFPYRLVRNFFRSVRGREHPRLIPRYSDLPSPEGKSFGTFAAWMFGGASLQLGLFNLLPVAILDGAGVYRRLIDMAFGSEAEKAFALYSLPAFFALWAIKGYFDVRHGLRRA